MSDRDVNGFLDPHDSLLARSAIRVFASLRAVDTLVFPGSISRTAGASLSNFLQIVCIAGIGPFVAEDTWEKAGNRCLKSWQTSTDDTDAGLDLRPDEGSEGGN